MAGPSAMKIAVIGAGLMGTQIGIEYALAGHDVTFVVRDEVRAASGITTTLGHVASLELAPPDVIKVTRSRLQVALAVRELDSSTALVVESVVEELATKIDVLGQAAAHLPAAILASNTSSISISAIAAGTGAGGRLLGTHYWNPPLLMPLVEVIATPETNPDVIQTILHLLSSLGKRPVLAAKDVPGFIWNRMQLALLREAVWLAEHGVASPAAIDQVVREGLARRWRYTGPFQTAALGGADTFERIAANLWPEISAATRLENLSQWLDESPATLSATRERRDQGLRSDLARDHAAAVSNGDNG